MRNLLLLTLASLLVSCQYVEQIKQKIPFLKKETAVTEPKEYVPQAAPALEDDKVVQFTPRDRLLNLLEQFLNSPDATMLDIVMAEFDKNRSVFTTTIDAQLITVLNRAIPSIQQADPNVLFGMTQLLSFLVGDNKEHLRLVLSRGFDVSPMELAKLMSDRTDDKLCYISSLVPTEINPDMKRNYLESRLANVLNAKTVGDPKANIYLDQCERTLRLTLNQPVSGEPTAVVPEAAPAQEDSSAAPTEPPPAVSEPVTTP